MGAANFPQVSKCPDKEPWAQKNASAPFVPLSLCALRSFDWNTLPPVRHALPKDPVQMVPLQARPPSGPTRAPMPPAGPLRVDPRRAAGVSPPRLTGEDAEAPRPRLRSPPVPHPPPPRSPPPRPPLPLLLWDRGRPLPRRRPGHRPSSLHHGAAPSAPAGRRPIAGLSPSPPPTAGQSQTWARPHPMEGLRGPAVPPRPA